MACGSDKVVNLSDKIKSINRISNVKSGGFSFVCIYLYIRKGSFSFFQGNAT